MANYQSTSITSIISRLQQRTQAPSGTHWQQAEYVFAINEALRLWQALTGALTTVFNVHSSNLNGAYLEVPRQIASLTRVKWNSTPLALTSLAELDLGIGGSWEATRASAPTMWTPDGCNRLAVYPAPNVAGTFVLEGIADLATMDPGMNVQVGNDELTYILGYAHHYLTIKEGPSEMEATVEGLKKMVEAASQRNAQLRKTALYKRFGGLQRDRGQDEDSRSGSPSIGARS